MSDLAAAWPEADLEHLGRCPACGSDRSSLRLTGVRDKVFRVAEGEWTLMDCEGCGAAYLDPRPDLKSIGRAYSSYYTHSFDAPAPFWHKSDRKSRLMTGYLNGRYGYAFEGGLRLGSILVPLRRRMKLNIDYFIRHLEAPRRSGAKLLDVGCGSGQFVAVAEALGYEAVGIDPDPKAVEAGIAAGLNLAIGSLPDHGLTETRFDHITLSHVFEHLHEPRAAAERCFDLLAPGGRIWLSQPNLGAIGLSRFGSDWRGLEAPRHLSLYDYSSLRTLLEQAGFRSIQLLPSDEPAEFYYAQSSAMVRNRDPYQESSSDHQVRAEAAVANKRARKNPELGESLTVIAFRP